MTDGLRRQIGAFLAAHHVMSLATFGSSGPHATSLFYAYDGLALSGYRSLIRSIPGISRQIRMLQPQ